MAIDHEHGMEPDRNPGVEYDRSDLGAKGILIFFLVLAVSAVVIHLVVLGLYAGMTRYADKHQPEISPLARQTYKTRSEILSNTANVNTQQFPQPRLLPHVRGSGPGEMSEFLARETAVLTAKPWRDAQGNIHLPIDQAMQTVLARLPVRAGGVEPPNYPGAARDYSYPTAPDAAAIEQASMGQAGASTGEAGISPENK